ncbi:MAG: hypothetical protein ACYC27_12900 [Armatimonadota bacterium]
MEKRIIIGLQVTNRIKNVPLLQSLLSEYGCNIKTRLGLHEVSDSACSMKGLLLLEMCGDEAAILEMESKLKAIEGVNIQKMVFEG